MDIKVGDIVRKKQGRHSVFYRDSEEALVVYLMQYENKVYAWYWSKQFSDAGVYDDTYCKAEDLEFQDCGEHILHKWRELGYDARLREYIKDNYEFPHGFYNDVPIKRLLDWI